MKEESKAVTTADLATAGSVMPLEPIADRPPDGAVAETAEQPAPQNLQAERPGTTAVDTTSASLFEPKETEGLRNRWNEIQVGFVDEPRAAVERADTLVAETIKRLADSFATSRHQLESEWDREGDVSTEGLRVALQRYRSFFNRLLSI